MKAAAPRGGQAALHSTTPVPALCRRTAGTIRTPQNTFIPCRYSSTHTALPPPPPPTYSFTVLPQSNLRLETAEFLPPASLYDPSRPTVVMLHEALGSVSLWGTKFPAQLAAATRSRVLAFSRAVYGTSDDAPYTLQPRTVDYLHREGLQVLPAFLKAAGIEKPPLLFGHSDGGTIALLFAAAYPGALAGAAVLAPHIAVDELTIAGVQSARRQWEAAPELLNSAVWQAGKTHHRGSLQRARARFQDWNDIWLQQAFQAFFDIRETHLPDIQCPLLAMQGLQDEFGRLQQVEAVQWKARRSSMCRVMAIENCGHSPHKDQPAVVLQAMAEFAEQVVVSGGNLPGNLKGGGSWPSPGS